MRRLNIGKMLAVTFLAMTMAFPQTAMADTEFDGWDDEAKDDAWTTYELTDWTQFTSIGTLPSSVMTNSCRANVNSKVRSFEEMIRERLKGDNYSYTVFTEICLAVLQVQSAGVEPDVFGMQTLHDYDYGDIPSAEHSILLACAYRFVPAIDRLKEAGLNPYSADKVMQTFLFSFFANDLDCIDAGIFPDQEFGRSAAKDYLTEKGYTEEEITEIFDKISKTLSYYHAVCVSNFSFVNSEVASYALTWLGKGYYTPAASDMDAGLFDCSGFITGCYRMTGHTDSYHIYSGAWAELGTEVTLEEAQPGDVCYYPGHVTMYIGDYDGKTDQVIGIGSTSKPVHMSDVNGFISSGQPLISIRRIPDHF